MNLLLYFFQDLYVPCGEIKQQKSNPLLDQLIELASRDSTAANFPSDRGTGSPVPSDLSPKTPCRNTNFAGGQEEDHQIVNQMPFTSVLMTAALSGFVDVKGTERVVEDEELMLDCGPNTDYCAQVLCLSKL